MSDASTRPAPRSADLHWVVLRRRVALAGRVLRDVGSPGAKDATGEPARGGVVTLSAAAALIEAPVRPSGIYVFCDLAPGEYMTGGHDEFGFSIEAKRVTIPPPDRLKKPTLLAFDLRVARVRTQAGGRQSSEFRPGDH